jgi:hypothetical protein
MGDGRRANGSKPGGSPGGRRRCGARIRHGSRRPSSPHHPTPLRRSTRHAMARTSTAPTLLGTRRTGTALRVMTRRTHRACPHRQRDRQTRTVQGSPSRRVLFGGFALDTLDEPAPTTTRCGPRHHRLPTVGWSRRRCPWMLTGRALPVWRPRATSHRPYQHRREVWCRPAPAFRRCCMPTRSPRVRPRTAGRRSRAP